MKHKFFCIVLLIFFSGQISDISGAFYTRGLYHDNDYSQIISKVVIKSVSISIQPHGSYLDISEQAVICPMLTLLDSIVDYWVEGTVSLPKNSTIIQFTLTDSSGTFSSRILPVYKENHPVDTTLSNPLAVISLQSTSDSLTTFQVKISKLDLGKNYIIAFRYLVPNTGSATPVHNLHVLTHNPSLTPGVIEFSFRCEKPGPTYALSIGSSNFQLADFQSLQIPYKKEYRIKAVDNVSTKQHLTSFEEGDYQGKYLLLNTTVPDSVLSQLSKPIEIVFLWRWNKPTSFIKKNSAQGTSWLTTYGQNTINQASAINTMLHDVAITGNQLGMVHSIQYRKPEVFPLCKKGSASFTVLSSYLAQMDEDYFLNSGYYEEIIAPVNPDDTLSDSSRYEFIKSLNIVKGLYSNGAGIIKHLIILTSGPVRNSRDIITLEELDPLIGDISVSCDRAFWKDVSFANVENGSFHRELVNMGSFKVPQFRPSSLILQLTNTGKTYSFPLSIDQNAFSIIAKSKNTWSPELVWYGFDKSGAPFDSARSSATVYQSENDTGLIKLWAANSERISEKVENDIEAQYGVISTNYEMRIYPSFNWNDTSMGYAVAYNYYVDKTSKLDNKSEQGKNGLFCFLKNRIVNISLPDNDEIKRIKIFSLNGSLIADIDPISFKTKSSYLIPLKALFSSKTSGMVLLCIEGKRSRWTQRIWIS